MSGLGDEVAPPAMKTHSFVVSRAEAGRSLAAALGARLRLGQAEARRLIHGRWVRLDGRPCLEPGRRLAARQRVEIMAPPTPARAGHAKPATSRSSGPLPVIRYVDRHIVVVDKPAGLTTVRHREELAELGARARRYLPPSLVDILPGVLAKAGATGGGRLRAVHRLDKDTSGLVVLARTPEAESRLGRAFRAHAIGRSYLALVRGQARNGRTESYLVRDRGDGRRGSSAEPGTGKRAITNVRVVEEMGEYTLVECRLETGRTHQVRIHLAESGAPICGEQVYDRPLRGQPVPDTSGARRLALHAAHLSFTHPVTGKPMSWDSPLPKDLRDLLARLRK